LQLDSTAWCERRLVTTVKTYQARSPEELERIGDLVHDRLVDLETMAFDPASRSLRLPLSVVDPNGELRRRILGITIWRHPVRRATLRIDAVESYGVVDDAKTGDANINELLYQNGTLTITCGMPVTIKARVSALSVALELHHEVVEHKTYWLWHLFAPHG
jgi:hypothetical protein